MLASSFMDDFELIHTRTQVTTLIQQIGALTGEPKEQVVLRALEERFARLTGPTSAEERRRRVFNGLDTSLWSNRRPTAVGALTKDDEDEALGYGPEGV